VHNTIIILVFASTFPAKPQRSALGWRWLRIYTRDNDNSGTAEVTRLGRLLWKKVTNGNHPKSIFPSTVIQWCTLPSQRICIVSIYNNKQRLSSYVHVQSLCTYMGEWQASNQAVATSASALVTSRTAARTTPWPVSSCRL